MGTDVGIEEGDGDVLIVIGDDVLSQGMDTSTWASRLLSISSASISFYRLLSTPSASASHFLGIIKEYDALLKIPNFSAYMYFKDSI